MSDKYPSLSPYNYCAWNPVINVDPDGNDHWKIDEDGNATLVDTKGSDIYVNDVLITKYKFNSQDKLDALATIGTYYYNQNEDASSLYNDKISVLSYEKNRLTGSSNWDLKDKPYDMQTSPFLFSYSKKQYNIDANRIVLPVENGYIPDQLDTRGNMRNSFFHEGIHLLQPFDKFSYSKYFLYYELEAYMKQMQQSTWKNTTTSFRKNMLQNANKYINIINNSNNSQTKKDYKKYINFFNSIKP